MSDNVIVGPWTGEPPKRYSEEEKKELVVQALVKELSDAVFDGMRSAGFDNCDDIVYSKDLALIAESIRSYLLKLQDDYHPMQQISEAVFSWHDGKIVTENSVNVTFKD